MERFVQSIVAGGVVLVGACWLVVLADGGSAPWLVGVALALLGTGAVLAGILSELEPGAFAVGEE
ncbi:hypothetical protein [Natrinema versiforme]|uniref:Uncharacterized protein n=1 Tax=Natrinema versiforme JCM 10478 TaxID=1227496 RepID=L9Y3A3_9EURY|nr:hypothetical protein [Natrinema versiforme]ELY68549.1 hypothetical protein C489_07610 [Natrinema versiforme JCM 10478]